MIRYNKKTNRKNITFFNTTFQTNIFLRAPDENALVLKHKKHFSDLINFHYIHVRTKQYVSYYIYIYTVFHEDLTKCSKLLQENRTEIFF